MVKCKHCKVEKPESDMALWAGKPSMVCLECKPKHPTGAGARPASANGAAQKKAKRAKAETPELVLSIPAGGFGVDAQITEEGLLQLTQGNDGADPDNVCLTKREVRELFNTFGEWAVTS